MPDDAPLSVEMDELFLVQGRELRSAEGRVSR